MQDQRSPLHCIQQGTMLFDIINIIIAAHYSPICSHLRHFREVTPHDSAVYTRFHHIYMMNDLSGLCLLYRVDAAT